MITTDPKDLVAVTVVFNPAGWQSRVRLYKEFADYIKSCGVKLYTVEIAFADRPYECTVADDPWSLQLRTHTEMWHKEAGLNAAVKEVLQLVPEVKNIAWLDADIKFSNANWPQDTVKALEKYAVIQPYSEAHNLNPKGESMWKCPSIFAKYDSRGYSQAPPLPLNYFSNGHPGLAWAARTHIIDKLGGLLDFCVAGSGDTHMANAMMGDVTLNMRSGMAPGYKRALERFAEKCDRFIKRNIGFVPGIASHYWHGKSEQRGYEKRWDIQCFHKFDPNEDIYKGIDGLYKWTGNKIDLVYDLRRSMSQRNEDSTDL